MTHDPDECTDIGPDHVEVLRFRDQRHVVLPADEYDTLIGLAAEQNSLNERLNADIDRYRTVLQRITLLVGEGDAFDAALQCAKAGLRGWAPGSGESAATVARYGTA